MSRSLEKHELDFVRNEIPDGVKILKIYLLKK